MNKRDRRTKERTCKHCGTNWWPENGGAGKRLNSACDTCYPYERKAVNLLAATKDRAVRKNLEHDLDIEFITKKLKQPCPRTGLPFRLGKTGSSYADRDIQTPSVDKIDPSKGYTKDNVQIVCWGYNVAKQRFTDEEVLEFWKNVVDYHVRVENRLTDTLSKKMDGEDVLESVEEKISPL